MKPRVQAVVAALSLCVGCTSGGTQSNLITTLKPTPSPAASVSPDVTSSPDPAASSSPSASPTPAINEVANPTPAPIGTLANFQAYTTNGNLVYPVALSAPLAIGNRVYLFGGTSDWSNPVDKIQSAVIDASGNLGAFEAAGTLTSLRSGAAAIQIGSHVYVLGGSKTTREDNPVNTIERATIQADGSLGAFEPLSTTMNSPRSDFNVVWTGPWLYAIGGMQVGTTSGSRTVERAQVLPDGSLGAFQNVAEIQLVKGRQTQAATTIGNKLYILGGEEAPGQTLKSIETADINLTTGEIGAFSTYPSTLTDPRNRISLAALGNNLYLFGGYKNPNFLSSIDSAPINIATFALGSFANSTTTQLASAVESGASLVTAKYAYYFGGHNDSGVTSTIQRSAIE